MHLHAYVIGEVQGVGFRAHTVRVARSLGLTGWVRNLDDGRVEVVAEGTHSTLRELLSWLQHGPSLAEVDDVENQFTDNEEGFRDFTISY